MFGGSSDSGFGGWLWYQMGRSAAEDDRIESNAVRTVLGLNRSQVDLNALVARNRALAADNAQLRNELQVYAQNYDTLRAWAERAEKRLKAFEEKRDQPLG